MPSTMPGSFMRTLVDTIGLGLEPSKGCCSACSLPHFEGVIGSMLLLLNWAVMQVLGISWVVCPHSLRFKTVVLVPPNASCQFMLLSLHSFSSAM